MKTEQEIKERLQWLIQQLDEPECQSEVQQAKIYAQIDFARWLLGGTK